MVNRSLEQYLRAFAAAKPTALVDWLPLAEFWFNTNFHSSTKVTPFEALYGFPPPRLLDYIPSTTSVEVVDDHLQKRQQIMSLLKQNLLLAQERMKVQVDRHRVERSFVDGEWVYVKLQPYRQWSLKPNALSKLSPFQVLHKVGEVAYKLALPTASLIHHVFHVSCLKAKIGQQVTPISQLPFVSPEGILTLEPEAILKNRSVKL